MYIIVKQMKTSLRNFLIFAAVLVLLGCVWYFRNIVAYIIVSGVLSFVGRPLVDIFSKIHFKKWFLPKSVSALLSLVVMWTVIVTFFYIFVPLVSTQIDQFSSMDSQKIVQLVEGPINKVESVFRAFNKDIKDEISVEDFVLTKVSSILSAEFIQNFLSSLVSILGNIAVAIFSITFITFFFLKDQHLFFESIVMWVPEKYEENITRALFSIKNLLTRYFIGIIIQSTCIMILITTGMTIVGIDFQQALVMGLILGTLNVIPYVGPWIGGVIGVIMGVASNMDQDFTTRVIPLVTYMILVVGITHLIDNVVFQPVIFSNSVKAHPLEIFIVILAAGSFAGVAGMILAIPAYTMLRVFAREFFYSFKVVQKLTSSLAQDIKMEKKITEDPAGQ